MHRIIGALEEHKKHTDYRLDRIETKIDGLQGFRWKLLGVSTVISFLVAALLEVVVVFYSK